MSELIFQFQFQENSDLHSVPNICNSREKNSTQILLFAFLGYVGNESNTSD